jgi:hypothetical protein
MTAYANLPHRVNVLKQKKDQAIFSSLDLVYKEYSKSLLKLQTELVASNQLTDANAVQSEFFLNTGYIDLIGKSYQFVFDRHRPLPDEAKIYRETRNEKVKISLKKNLTIYLSELKKAQSVFFSSQNMIDARKASDEIKIATYELQKISLINVQNAIPENAIFFNGHGYLLFRNILSWDKAKIFCQKLGGHLVVIETEEERKFLKKIAGDKAVWVGGNDFKKEGKFEWLNGKEFILKVADNASHRDCVIMAKGGGLAARHKGGDFNDFRVKRVQGFICEW